jgi:demethylmenaquinone methyltransferase/2-methoxy-6-polyprenyl-1,4-benzoquinol methylase
MNKNLITYYGDRANEYEDIYLKPERQKDLKKINNILLEIFSDKDVLEIACGTEYWTERISETAKSILAIDINDTVLGIAKNKRYPKNNVRFQKQDLFSFNPGAKFESLFGGFIGSHVKLQELDNFLDKLNSFVKYRGSIILLDNNYIEGSNHPITDKDEFGNTYQTRTLKDNSSHLVLKNFPSEEFIMKKLEGKAEKINFINLKYYWLLNYENKS